MTEERRVQQGAKRSGASSKNIFQLNLFDRPLSNIYKFVFCFGFWAEGIKE